MIARGKVRATAGASVNLASTCQVDFLLCARKQNAPKSRRHNVRSISQGGRRNGNTGIYGVGGARTKHCECLNSMWKASIYRYTSVAVSSLCSTPSETVHSTCAVWVRREDQAAVASVLRFPSGFPIRTAQH